MIINSLLVRNVTDAHDVVVPGDSDSNTTNDVFSIPQFAPYCACVLDRDTLAVVGIYAYVLMLIYTYIIHIYSYIHTYIHTYANTYIFQGIQSRLLLRLGWMKQFKVHSHFAPLRAIYTS